MNGSLFWAIVLMAFMGAGCSGFSTFEMAGELSSHSALLQSRSESKFDDGVFEIDTSQNFSDPRTFSLEALPLNPGSVAKTIVSDLQPDTLYFYRFRQDSGYVSAAQSFKTLQSSQGESAADFVVWTCANQHYFQSRSSLSPDENKAGYPALKVIHDLDPDFVVSLGDGVYYDSPPHAKKESAMRRKWLSQFSYAGFRQLFARTGTFWLVDDHDYRFDGADPGREEAPSHDVAMKVFFDELPLQVQNRDKILYRTFLVNRWLQVWLVDGRSMRSPNAIPDGPGKSAWGDRQKQWLKKTLLASQARYKLILHSTALVGPVSAQDADDNHAVPNGFTAEKKDFFKWLDENNQIGNVLFLIGDAHWKYHSVDPSGLHEFSVGPLDASNAVMPYAAGDEGSSDPEGLINQLYIDQEEIGGFARVQLVPPGPAQADPKLVVSLYSQNAQVLHSAEF